MDGPVRPQGQGAVDGDLVARDDAAPARVGRDVEERHAALDDAVVAGLEQPLARLVEDQ